MERAPDACRTLPPAMARWRMPQPLDDATQRYIAQARPVFNALLDGTRQLAAVLILQAAGAGKELPGHPMLMALHDELGALREQAAALRVSPSARHFDRHLQAALRAIGRSLGASAHLHRPGKHGGSAQAALHALQVALQELTRAARVLPGFETVALGQACCADCRAVPAATPFSALMPQKHKG